MGSGALDACEVSLHNKYAMLMNTEEAGAHVQSKPTNPANGDFVACARGVSKRAMQIRSQR